MTEMEIRVRRAVSFIAGDKGATYAFRIAVGAAVIILYVVGRHQWFTRDDWAYVISRDALFQSRGWQHWLFEAQDGHWLTIPILIFHFTTQIFGLGSYWPFLIPTMVAHVGAVFLVRSICRRVGVSAWTTTLVCSMLLVFGSGWDNIVFAIQISYNLSLVAFLAQVLLVDHDGPVDRRDYFAAALGVVCLVSSGFGPIFTIGVLMLLLLRRRGKALAVVVLPQVIVYAWWYLAWETDPAADKLPGNRAELPAYLVRGVTATFESMVTVPALAGIAIVAALAVALWSGIAWRARTTLISMWITVIVMFLAIGFERIGFGVPTAASSRYLHISAMLIAPVLALTVDQLARISREVRWAGRLLLAVAVAANAGSLRLFGAQWALESRAEKTTFELIAGSPLAATADPFIIPSKTSPNVALMWLPWMIERDAITPRVTANDAERQMVLIALGQDPAPTPTSTP